MPKPEHLRSFVQPGKEPDKIKTVRDGDAFEVGGRRFEFYSAPSGETLDSLLIWLPEEKTLFTGNFMGALYGALPNFYTLRGDRARSVPGFLSDIQRVLDLKPELLITGHGAPIVGNVRIAADLTKLRDAVRYIHDETVKGMNAQRDLNSLMRDIQLPPHLTMAPGRGRVAWYVRAVWEEYSGWFLHEATSELYPIPARSIWGELKNLAGGADALVERARGHIAGGRPVEALHFIEIALTDEPSHRAAREAQLAALNLLVERTNGEVFDELGWLESEIGRAEAALSGKP
jgi:alkyl sulfatase BDS1-like metallo-beta-lactamase superfamily hydrolase